MPENSLNPTKAARAASSVHKRRAVVTRRTSAKAADGAVVSVRSIPRTLAKATDVKNAPLRFQTPKPAARPSAKNLSGVKVAIKNNSKVTRIKSQPSKPQRTVDSFVASKAPKTPKTPMRKPATINGANAELNDLAKRARNYDARNAVWKAPAKPAPKKQSATKSKKTPQKLSFMRLFGWFLTALLGLSSLVLAIMLAKIGFLPFKYFAPIIIVLVALATALGFVMCKEQIKPRAKIPVFLLTIILSVVYLSGITYLDKTFNFFDSIRNPGYLTENYYVMVNKDSGYKELYDLRDKTITYYNEDADISREALKKLQALVKADFQTVGSVRELTDALINHETDAILISAVHQKAMADIDESEDKRFNTDTTIIHTITIRVDAEELVSDKVNVTTEPFTIYISGIDASDAMFNGQRGLSDVNMLVTVNPKTHEVLLTSIPRDYYVQFHGTTGNRNKLTHAGMYGIKMSVQTIEDFLGIDINYYLKVNFATIVGLVDAIDGIEVTTDQDIRLSHADGFFVPKGTSHMDGRIALAFARERYGYSTGDRHRIKNQQDVLTGIIKKISTSAVILTRYSEILSTLASSLSTNMSQEEISSLIKMQLQYMPSWKIGQYRLDGANSHGPAEFMGSSESRFVMEPYPETIETGRKNIEAILAGESLASLNLPAAEE